MLTPMLIKCCSGCVECEKVTGIMSEPYLIKFATKKGSEMGLTWPEGNMTVAFGTLYQE